MRASLKTRLDRKFPVTPFSTDYRKQQHFRGESQALQWRYTEQAMDILQGWLAIARKGDSSPDAESRLRAVESTMGFRFPDPVRFLLTTADRPEGFVGESYIAFFAVDDLAQCLADVQRAAPGFIPFASNGGGEWYGVDSRLNTPAFVLLPAIGAEWSAAMFLGSGWEEFWKTLQRGDLFERSYQVTS